MGIRIQDLFDENILRQKVEGALDQKNHLLVKVFNRRAITVDEIVDDLLAYADRLRPMVADTALVLHEALERGETVLFEGGQATMLDVDHGTYPFVTSSNATAGGAATGAGIGPNRIDRVIGIVKAYTTRVGAGPFPTELFDESGEFLRKTRLRVRHHDRPPPPRGWYDAPIARYTARINGVTDFVMTKLDVLTGLERIPVCVAYEVDGVRVRRGARLADRLPPRDADLRGVPRLDGGHHGCPHVRRPAEERAGLRARHRGDERRAHLRDRRRAGPRRDRRAARPARLSESRDRAHPGLRPDRERLGAPRTVSRLTAISTS